MVGAAATASRRAPSKKRGSKRAKFRSADELHDVLDGLLSAVDADEKAGPLLRAAGLRLRLEFPDLAAVVNLAASEEPSRHIEWSFSDRGVTKPKLELKMGSDVANGWLQGTESVPVAIARGEIACSGDARCALLYLPAAKLFNEPYRKLLRERYPHLLIRS
jgi:hypothetical protein